MCFWIWEFLNGVLVGMEKDKKDRLVALKNLQNKKSTRGGSRTNSIQIYQFLPNYPCITHYYWFLYFFK